MTKVDDVIRHFRGIFHILGLWPICPLAKRHNRGAIFAFIFFLIFPLTMCCLSLLQVKSVEEFARAILHIFGFSFAALSAILLRVYRPKLQKFFSELSELGDVDADAESFIDGASVKALKIGKFVLFCESFVASLGSLVIPLVFGVLPFPMWTPDWNNSTAVFGIYWAIEFFSFNYGAQLTNIIFLCFVALYIINGYGQFLNNRLRMLVSTEDHDGYLDLVKCKENHQKFIKMIQDVKTIWGVIIGAFYKAVVIVIGASIFVITRGEDRLTFRENLIFYAYIAISIIYMYILSYFGELIYSTSSQFSYALFSSDWVYADMKYKKSMIIMMENMKKPVKVSGLFYDSINLKLFQDTVNEGYSMFSVFQNLKKKINS